LFQVFIYSKTLTHFPESEQQNVGFAENLNTVLSKLAKRKHFGERKLKINKKQIFCISALILLLASTLLAGIQIANAHSPAWNVPTFAYISAGPNPIGVRQTAFIVFWLDKVPPTAGGIGGERWGNLTVSVTKPDGLKETLGPFISDPVGSGYAQYTPDQTGTYSFTFNFPGQVVHLAGPTGIVGVASDYINDTFLPSSAATTLTVQQAQTAPVPDFPLPTGYWVRPIEGENTEWVSIASNWLMGAHIIGKYQPDGLAPNSAHIMWTKAFQFGGVVGGSNTGITAATFYSGLSYEVKMASPIIMYGRVYYNLPRADAATGNGYVCVDLRTGEQIYWQNLTMPSFGQLYDYETFNQHGVVPNGYLWRTLSDPANGGTVWMAYDPLDGNWLFNITNVPSGTQAYGPNGEILIAQMNYAKRWLALWNNTAAPDELLTPGTTTNAFQWRPVGKNVNGSTAYSWNVTIPDLPGQAAPSILRVFPDDLILGASSSLAGFSGFGTPDPYTLWAISLKPASRGQLLWLATYPAPANNITRMFGQADAVTRVFTMYDKEVMQWSGYNLDSGQKLWGPTSSEGSWNFYTASALGEFATIGGGQLFSGGYSGVLTCYNLKTGSIQWKYNNTYSGFETPYGNYPLSIAAVADGKIYLYTSEHSPNVPPYKGVLLRCVNATDGKELWTVPSWLSGGAGTGYAVADGYFAYINLYDMQIYSIGKGPCALTVSGPQAASTQGQSVVISGTVSDQSAGAKQKVQSGEFSVVPAMSDESMSAWMQYVYMQKPMPTNAKGVSVKLTAIDSNGNTQNIGTAVSDTNGNYGIMWVPPIPGLYKVIATFAGSASFGGSSATAYIGVDAATKASPAVTQTPASTSVPIPTPVSTPAQTTSPSPSPAVIQPASGTSTVTYIALGAAVIVVFAVAAALILRKRK
jgi:hypothetical protein